MTAGEHDVGERVGSGAVERRGKSASIVLGRDERSDVDTWGDLRRVCCDLAQDDELLVVIIAGSLDSLHDQFRDSTAARPDVVEAVAALPQVVIAVLEDEIAGAGLEIALACDLRLASTDARLSFPEVRRGQIPGAAVTQRLPRIVGPARAAELILTAGSVDAPEAHAIGLVHNVAAPEAVDDLVRTVVDGISSSAPLALRYAKEALRRGSEMSLESALVFEHDLYLLLQTTNDRLEGLAAYRERREPTFGGN